MFKLGQQQIHSHIGQKIIPSAIPQVEGQITEKFEVGVLDVNYYWQNMLARSGYGQSVTRQISYL
jgi:hypothetical protein